jgi:RHS repeat-associated protein
MEWTKDSIDYRNLYTYDANGNLATKQEQLDSGSGYAAAVSWTYTWDVQDRLTKVLKEDADFGGTDLLTAEYAYCPACGGALRYRIEKDGSGNVISWLRYEYEGLNLLRIDQVYDKDNDSVLEEPADGDDAWRVLNVYVHAPGSISQIIRNKSYAHVNKDATPDWTWNIYYYYDALGNMLTYSHEGGYGNYEMDAFGNQIPGSPGWPNIDSNGPKERLTGKMYDNITGLYYFSARWLDPEVGRFVSVDPVKSWFHPYALAAGNPNAFVDPAGTDAYGPEVMERIRKSEYCFALGCKSKAFIPGWVDYFTGPLWWLFRPMHCSVKVKCCYKDEKKGWYGWEEYCWGVGTGAGEWSKSEAKIVVGESQCKGKCKGIGVRSNQAKRCAQIFNETLFLAPEHEEGRYDLFTYNCCSWAVLVTERCGGTWPFPWVDWGFY